MWTTMAWKVVGVENLHWKPKFTSVIITKRVQEKEFGVNVGNVIISWKITYQNMIWNHVFHIIQNIIQNTYIYIQLTYNIKSNAHIYIHQTY
jgi:hypothetical protein